MPCHNRSYGAYGTIGGGLAIAPMSPYRRRRSIEHRGDNAAFAAGTARRVGLMVGHCGGVGNLRMARRVSPPGRLREPIAHRGHPIPALSLGRRDDDDPFYTSGNNEFRRPRNRRRSLRHCDRPRDFDATRTVRINPNGEMEFGRNIRQVLNLWDTPSASAFRAYAVRAPDQNFAWYQGGVHNDTAFHPGTGACS